MVLAITRAIIFSLLIILYCFLFSVQENKAKNSVNSLHIALPANFQKFFIGYLKHITVEMLFIRTSIFLGGAQPDTLPSSYENILENNLEVMTQLYPEFIDPYFYCQGFLAPISIESVAKTNTILETGIKIHPNNIYLRLFLGVNYFLQMNEPLKGAKVFAETAKLPGAPPMFGHLAALLSAQGGDIIAGLISLKTMLMAEQEEIIRYRYKEEIVIFEQALEVQQALYAYSTKYGSAPQLLEQLIPEFLPNLPVFQSSFSMTYTPPNIYLKRPTSK